ncbi:MAG: fibronectin type III domain-containing protein [Actinomyces sp.]|jgi:hypothetical protein|nr:fibronectin type III domain-containing protein [Actinomyces sp.]MCI1787321.1 fibronectin type III domain-containing protein [Actinomyces sp.]MCI1830859.1 fibronectin type III domain-containing protein [Actinomyces sp.]
MAAGPAAVAADASYTVDDATFQWGVNAESGGGAYFGGCNFLSAGEAGDAGGSGLWAEDAGLYATQDGNVTVLKPDADGDLVEPTWTTKCQNRYGTTINGKTAGLTITGSGATAGQPTYSENVVRIAGGSGTLDPSTDSAHIEWDGSFTIVYYGGMTYWSISDPVLDVENGTGTITGTASGYGADMDDPSIWKELDTSPIHVADLSGVEVSESGIEVTPDFLGIAVSDEISGRNAQSEPSEANESWWGAFPDSWLRYAVLTGQSSYWYTTDGSATSIQPRKPAAPISISYTAERVATAPAAPPAPTLTVASSSSATATWTAPADDGGSALTGYAVTLTPDDGSDPLTQTVGADQTSSTFTGLLPGVSYTATVSASNGLGQSAASAASEAVTPNPDPGELTLAVTPTADIDPDEGTTFTVSGTGYTGGAAVNGVYVVVADGDVWTAGKAVASANDFLVSSWVRPAEIAAGAFTTTITVPAGTLDPSKTYVVGTMAAHQLALTDRRLDKDVAISLREATVPGAPTSVTATAGADSVDVTWATPADNGGSEVTGYTVTLLKDGQTVGTRDASSDAASATFPDLEPGTYTASVAAVNARGSSAPASSDPVTIAAPATEPQAPAAPTLTATSPTSLTVAWKAPADGGAALTGYTVTLTPDDGSGPLTQTVEAGRTSFTFTGLTTGLSYTATVSAANTVGVSMPSAASTALTLKAEEAPTPDPSDTTPDPSTPEPSASTTGTPAPTASVSATGKSALAATGSAAGPFVGAAAALLLAGAAALTLRGRREHSAD